jgi:hypothetical protein
VGLCVGLGGGLGFGVTSGVFEGVGEGSWGPEGIRGRVAASAGLEGWDINDPRVPAIRSHRVIRTGVGFMGRDAEASGNLR